MVDDKNKIEYRYKELLEKIITENSKQKVDKNNSLLISHLDFEYDMEHGFPMLPNIWSSFENIIDDVINGFEYYSHLTQRMIENNYQNITFFSNKYKIEYEFIVSKLSISDRLNLASEKYKYFDPFDFGLPAKLDHGEIDRMYPVPNQGLSLKLKCEKCDMVKEFPTFLTNFALLLNICASELGMSAKKIDFNIKEAYILSKYKAIIKSNTNKLLINIPDGIFSKSSEITFDNFKDYKRNGI